MLKLTSKLHTLGSALISLAGLGMIIYAASFIVFSFTNLIEIGLAPDQLGRTRDEIKAFSPDLYNYINHVQVNLGAFIAVAGVATAATSWFGIRRGWNWAWWTVAVTTIIWGTVGISVHYPYGFGSLEHLIFPYLALVSIGVGLFLAKPRQITN